MSSAIDDADPVFVADEDDVAADAAAARADAHAPRRGRPMFVLAKPIASTIYVDAAPTSLPPGRVFVHDVAPQLRGGAVRYWHAPAGAKGLRVCGCSLAPSLGIHFKAGR